MTHLTSWCMAAVVAFGCSACRVEARDPPRLKDEITTIVRTIEAAARKGEVAPIAALVHPVAMQCADDLISRADVLANLEKRGGNLNAFFFDGDTLRREYKSLDVNLSLREFEQRSSHTDVEVFEVVRGSDGELATCCARLNAEGVAFAPVMCFFREKGTWFLGPVGRFCG